MAGDYQAEATTCHRQTAMRYKNRTDGGPANLIYPREMTRLPESINSEVCKIRCLKLTPGLDADMEIPFHTVLESVPATSHGGEA